MSYVDAEKIRLAMTIAYNSYDKLFIDHSIEISKILSSIHSDIDTIISGLLYGILDNTNITDKFIENVFGTNVINIVRGVYNSNYNISISSPLYEYNLKKMILIMKNDWRIIHVKLADRLNFLRISTFQTNNIIDISKETLFIYAPLAHKLGIWDIKTELEDLSFAFINPKEYDRTSTIVRNRLTLYNQYKNNTKNILRDILTDNIYYKYSEESRVKSVYSVWKKSQKRQCSIEEIHDLVAIRIIISDDWLFDDSSTVCFQILSKIHSRWPVVHGSVKDYINSPKNNGYQSLHTTIFMMPNLPVEIQIRTQKMHQIAMHGTAAHWKYKQDNFRTVSWLEELTKNNNINNSNLKDYTNFVDILLTELSDIKYIKNNILNIQ
tara:strand:- start:1878 stop:3017 length:1140 start_codon:yes stop_codon:yes gene_type:complete